jgi:hypothetical protein
LRSGSISGQQTDAEVHPSALPGFDRVGRTIGYWVSVGDT